jgi:hypothetical protein
VSHTYKVFRFEITGDPEAATAFLNKQSQEGWEYIEGMFGEAQRERAPADHPDVIKYMSHAGTHADLEHARLVCGSHYMEVLFRRPT